MKNLQEDYKAELVSYADKMMYGKYVTDCIKNAANYLMKKKGEGQTDKYVYGTIEDSSTLKESGGVLTATDESIKLAFDKESFNILTRGDVSSSKFSVSNFSAKRFMYSGEIHHLLQAKFDGSYEEALRDFWMCGDRYSFEEAKEYSLYDFVTDYNDAVNKIGESKLELLNFDEFKKEFKPRGIAGRGVIGSKSLSDRYGGEQILPEIV